MANVIYKYPLAVTDVQNVAMPKDAKLLHVGDQYGILTLWAMVDPSGPQVDRTFYVVGTGNPLATPDELGTYVGTVQQGSLVWHLFDGGD